MLMYECLSPTDKKYSLRHLPRFRIKTNTYLLQTKCRSSGANKIYMHTFFFFFFFSRDQYNDAKWIGYRIILHIQI